MNAAVPEKLFEVPRIGIVVDETDPTVLKLTLSGSVELDRTNRQQVDFYNALQAGETHEVVVTVYVAGARMRHRYDAEDDVVEVAQTKVLAVTDVYCATLDTLDLSEDRRV